MRPSLSLVSWRMWPSAAVNAMKVMARAREGRAAWLSVRLHIFKPKGSSHRALIVANTSSRQVVHLSMMKNSTTSVCSSRCSHRKALQPKQAARAYKMQPLPIRLKSRWPAGTSSGRRLDRRNNLVRQRPRTWRALTSQRRSKRSNKMMELRQTGWMPNIPSSRTTRSLIWYHVTRARLRSRLQAQVVWPQFKQHSMEGRLLSSAPAASKAGTNRVQHRMKINLLAK